MKDFMMIFLGAADYSDLGLSPEDIQGRMGKWLLGTTKWKKPES